MALGDGRGRPRKYKSQFEVGVDTKKAVQAMEGMDTATEAANSSMNRNTAAVSANNVATKKATATHLRFESVMALGGTRANMLGKAFGGLKGGLKTAANGFRTLRGAIISTGIGAIVIAIVSLITAFTRFQGLMDKFNVVAAGFGAIFDNILDVLGGLGKVLFNVGKFLAGTFVKTWLILKGAIQSASISIKEFFGGDATELRKSLQETKDDIADIDAMLAESADGMKDGLNDVSEAARGMAEDFEKGQQLERDSIALKQKQIEEIEKQAQRERDVADIRAKVMDKDKLGAQERLDMLQKAMDLENQSLQENLDNAREAARIEEEKQKLAKSTREDEERLAEMKAEVFRLEKQSAEFERKMRREIVQTEREIETDRKKRYQDYQKRIQKQYDDELAGLQLIADRENELAAARGETDDQINARITKQLADQLQLAEQIKDKGVREKAIAEAQAEIDAHNHNMEVQRIQDETDARIKAEEDVKKAKESNAKDLEKLQEGIQRAGETPIEKLQREEAEKLAILKEALENGNIEREAAAAIEKQIKANTTKEIDDINQKSAEKQAADEKQLQDLKKTMALDGLNVVAELTSLFANRSEKAAKTVFMVDKSMKLASATMSAIEGTQNAYKTAQASPLTAVLPAYPAIQAGIAAAVGAANVAKIASTQFKSSSRPSPAGGGAGGGSRPAAPNFELPDQPQINRQAAVFDSQNQQPIQAYVVAGDVQDGMEANNQIQQRRTL